MKKYLILCLTGLTLGYSAVASVTEKKVITHRFANESAQSKLQVNSIYGNVNVTQADQDYIDIQVEINATARKKESAEKILDNIKISFSGKGASCSAKTEFKSTNRSNNEEKFEIIYTVTIPRGARLDITNKYGNTSLASMDGMVTADIKYGNINAAELNGSSNSIDIKYGSAIIGQTPSLDIALAYGSLKASNIAKLKINSRYSNVNADYVGNMQVSGSAYDTYTIGKVHTLNSSSGTSGISIGTLISSINLPSVKYGQVAIDVVEPGFESIRINSSYSNVRIGFRQPSFGYELRAKYGDVNMGDLPHNNKKEIRGYTEVTLQGTTGTNDNTKVRISTNYGSVNLGMK